MRNRNIKTYLKTALVCLISLMFAQILNAESENIIGHWSKLPTPKNMPAPENFWDLYPEEYPVVDNERGIIYILRNGGELWKYSIQDNAFTRIPTTNFPEEGYNYIYNPNENSIWFTHIGRGFTYRLPVTGGESEYIGGSGAYGDNYNSISYWNPVKKKFSLMFGYGYGSVKNWCWQFGIGDANWNLAQENKAGREPWPRMYTSMAQDLDGKRIFIGMGIGNSSGQQYILNPSFVNNKDYDYLRDLWCFHLEDNTWENLIPLNTIKPLRGKLVYYPDSDALFLLNTFTSTALPGDQIYGEYEQYEEGVWMMCLGKDSNFVKIKTDGEFPNSILVAYPFYDSINKRILYLNSEGAYTLSLEGWKGKVPQIITQPQNQTVIEGDPVTFSVTVTGGGIEPKNFTTPLSDSVNLDMVWCPPGTFIMGSPEDEIGRSGETQHQVTLTKGFWIGKYPITQAQYKAVIGSNPSLYVNDNNPVECVNWYDATNFCAKLTEFERSAGRLPEGYKYTLPTDAQWEYACRAGTMTALNSGKNLTNEDSCPNMDEVGWYQSNSGGHPHPVGQKLPNAWGLYDMHGNVWEWCLDYWVSDSYPDSQPVIDPTGPTFDTNRRIHRGGSSPDAAWVCRSATRWGGTPSLGHYGNGIRVILIESDDSMPSDFSYQWYKDGFMLQGATDSEYTINSVRQSDAGQYFVIVSNEFESVISDVAILAVNAPLVITRQPVGVSVQGGESATFSVEAENATSYQWYKNGFAIDGANQSSYTIEAVTSYDIAKYFVIVSNERISIASDIAALEISEAYRAKAEPIIANGFVIGFIITDPGWGYEWTPKVRVKDTEGSEAEAHCIVENGMVVGIEVDNPGKGYSAETYAKIGSPYKFNSLSVKISEIEITMHLNLGEKYQLESTEDHITWKKVGEPFIAEDEEVKLRLEVVDNIRYFRVHEVK